uniref:Uncharacterized protein n=1 Tax=Ditylenchus dipsaci TaxID=166011 RepID=A0A915D825_9BILA
MQYLALIVSIGVTVYTVGDFTRRIVHDKKAVLEIIYWRDPKRSGGALAVLLVASTCSPNVLCFLWLPTPL